LTGDTIKRYATDHVLPGLELQQGEYELLIESPDNDGDRDDFIVGKIVVASDGDVAIDRPTAPVAEAVEDPAAPETETTPPAEVTP